MLRKRIGYRGLVFSDDLEMGGILKFMPIEEAAIEAVRAGMDLMEICHGPELILRAYEALIAEAERSAAFRTTAAGAGCARTRQRAQRYLPTALPPALSVQEFEALRTRILRFSETIHKAQEAGEAIPHERKEHDCGRHHERHFGRRDRRGGGADRSRARRGPS